MKILHIFISLKKDSLYYDRLLKLNSIFPQYVLSCDKYQLPNFEVVNFYRTNYFNFPKFEFLKNYFFVKASFKCFNRNFKDTKFDLIHSTFVYPSASAGMVISKVQKLPHVITVRGSDVLIYPNQNAFLNSKIKEILQNAALVICVSKYLMNVCEGLGVDKKKLVHLPDGHDPNIFFYDKSIKKENFILFAGNLISLKNPLRLINAFELLSKGDDSIKLKMAGSGNLASEIRKVIQQKKLGDKVELIGQLPPKALAEQMRKAKVLVLPSQSEGWGNVLQESLACGTPIVASRVGGIVEIITEGENGFFCDYQSEQDIAYQIQKALNHSWSQVSLQSLPSLYTSEKIIERLMKLYQNLITKK